MKIDKSKVKKILVVNLSNIGDVILTTPVIQVLRRNFPQAYLAVLVGPRAFSVFKNDSRVDGKIIYDKSISWRNKLVIVDRIRHDKYNLVVDLRQTVFGIFSGARYRTCLFARAPKSLTHMKDRHLWKLKSLGLAIDDIKAPSVEFSEDEQNYTNEMFDKWQINPALPKIHKSSLTEKGAGIIPLPNNLDEPSDKRKGGVKDKQIVIAVAPGARSMTKRWEKKEYTQLIKQLIGQYNAKIIIVGDEQDELLAQDIISQIKSTSFNACGKTTIGQLAFLLTKCRLLVSNDSAPMHLAWAVNTPVVAIFGPTDYRKYAPHGPKDVVIRKNLACSPCKQSLCPKGTRECMKLIKAEEVFVACKRILDEKF